MSDIDHEKAHYAVGADSPTGKDRVGSIVATKGAAIGEAADIYGNVEEAEQFGYVERG